MVQVLALSSTTTGSAEVPTTEPTESATSITAGLTDRETIAATLKRSTRTIARLEHAGLPVIRLGMTRLYDIAKVRAWLLSHESRHEAPKRGRPAKRAA